MKNHRFIVIDQGFMGNYVYVVPFATDPISAAIKVVEGGADGAFELLVSTQDDGSEEVHAWIEWRVEMREDEHGFPIASIAGSAKRYMCRCDLCGIPLVNSDGGDIFNSNDAATEAANKSGWTIDGFKTKCPSCPAVDADATARQRRMRDGIAHQIAQSGGGDAPRADVATPLKRVYSDGSDVPFTIPCELHQELAKWGRDHWGAFAYLETRIVDHGGRPDHLHMRCNPKLHPHYGHGRRSLKGEYVTRTASGTIQNHDDWSCIEDAERLGLLSNVGTVFEPAYRFTDIGHRIALMLRRHLQQGRHASEFRM